MKKLILLSTFFFLFALSLFSQTLRSCENICNWPKAYLQGGTLSCGSNQVIFEDNFNGSNLSNRWQTFLWNTNHTASRIHNPCEEQIYLDKNVEVSNGTCKLIGRYEPGTTWTNSQGTTYTRDITSGVIQHVEGDNFRFAKFEARMKIPGTGWWPAFWMWHHDEIDIFENFWNDSQYSYNLYGSDECPVSSIHNVNLNDGNFHTFAVEFTPFAITYFCDGEPLPISFHRFHKLDGTPLIVNCVNNTIPSGTYYVNPRFVQIRERHFRPIINLAVLPKYGLCGCPYQNGCSSPLCFTCPNGNGGLGNCDWGYPINTNCEITGEIPAILEIDYVKYTNKSYNLCGALAVYGENCSPTGFQKEPLSCSRVCNGVMANLYLEDITGRNFLSQVTVNNVTSSSDITINSFDNYRIQYTRNSYNGPGEIYINYSDLCPNNTFTYRVKNNFEYEVNNIDPCLGSAEISFNNLEPNCAYSNFSLESVTITNSGGINISPQYSVDNNILRINFSNFYLIRLITLNIRNLCTNEVFPVRIDVPKCDQCCPNGFEYDGANCYSNFTFNGVNGFILNNNFYTTTNCSIYPTNNNCCPPGTTFDGTNCLYGPVEPGFTPFVLNGSFYTKTNCNKSCCPKGFVFDGANCYSKFHFIDVKGIMENGKFYTSQNCEKYYSNGCCPPGTVREGSKCFYGEIPPGYDGFIFKNSFYVKPNCNICCPPGYIYDGANCYSKKHFSGVELFIVENNFYTSLNCVQYQDNNCCPPGTIRQGNKCLIGPIPVGYIGFILGNTFYVKPKNCFEKINPLLGDDILESRITDIHIENENLIQIFPNPFGDEFTIKFGNDIEGVNKISIHDIKGNLVKVINKNKIEKDVTIRDLNSIGTYIVTISTSSKDIIYKIIKSN